MERESLPMWRRRLPGVKWTKCWRLRFISAHCMLLEESAKYDGACSCPWWRVLSGLLLCVVVSGNCFLINKFFYCAILVIGSLEAVKFIESFLEVKKKCCHYYLWNKELLYRIIKNLEVWNKKILLEGQNWKVLE